MNGSQRLANSLQELSALAQKLPEVKGLSLDRLYKSSSSLLDHADTARRNADMERTYVYLMKFANFFLDKLPQHRDYNKPAFLHLKEDYKKKCEHVLKELEELKKNLLLMYEEDKRQLRNSQEKMKQAPQAPQAPQTQAPLQHHQQYPPQDPQLLHQIRQTHQAPFQETSEKTDSIKKGEVTKEDALHRRLMQVIGGNHLPRSLPTINDSEKKKPDMGSEIERQSEPHAEKREQPIEVDLDLEILASTEGEQPHVLRWAELFGIDTKTDEECQEPKDDRKQVLLPRTNSGFRAQKSLEKISDVFPLLHYLSSKLEATFLDIHCHLDYLILTDPSPLDFQEYESELIPFKQLETTGEFLNELVASTVDSPRKILSSAFAHLHTTSQSFQTHCNIVKKRISNYNQFIQTREITQKDASVDRHVKESITDNANANAFGNEGNFQVDDIESGERIGEKEENKEGEGTVEESWKEGIDEWLKVKEVDEEMTEEKEEMHEEEAKGSSEGEYEIMAKVRIEDDKDEGHLFTQLPSNKRKKSEGKGEGEGESEGGGEGEGTAKDEEGEDERPFKRQKI